MKSISTHVFLSAFAVLSMLPAVLAPAAAADGNAAQPQFERVATGDGVLRVKSAYGVDETITRLKADIAAKGIKFFDQIDQQKLASDAGIKLNASTLLVFGNPPLGTQFLTANPYLRPRLAGADAGAAGYGRPGLDRLERFYLYRTSPSHHRPRSAIRDGDDGVGLNRLRGPGQELEPYPSEVPATVIALGLWAAPNGARSRKRGRAMIFDFHSAPARKCWHFPF